MSRSTMVVCPGSFNMPAPGVAYRQPRAKCPRCGRNIALRQSDMTLYRHTPTLSRSSREYARRHQAEQILSAMRWEPSGALTICVRWWFDFMGGAEAFDEFNHPLHGSILDR